MTNWLKLSVFCLGLATAGALIRPLGAAEPLASNGPAAPMPDPSSSPIPDFKMQLWTVREGYNVVNGATQVQPGPATMWRAERPLNASATVTRYPTITPSEAQPDAVVTLKESDDLMLRQKMSRISTTLPSKPSSKSRENCEHWIETESFQGKRFFCEGQDASEALDFVSTLRNLVK